MTSSIKPTSSIQVAKQMVTSKRQNFNFESMGFKDAKMYLRELEEDLAMYYQIRGH